VVRDWSTGTEDGPEHSLTLNVWSRTGCKKEMQEIIEPVRLALHDKPLLLEDHFLVNLRHEFSEARLDPDGDTFHGVCPRFGDRRQGRRRGAPQAERFAAGALCPR
jgi:hypothetical protein